MDRPWEMASKFKPVLKSAFPAVFLLAASLSFLTAHRASSQERKLSISFTKEILYTLASDNPGEKNREMIDRIIGLSPGISRVVINREGNHLIMIMTTSAGELRELIFRLEFDKMDLYKMAVAKTDVDGINSIMNELKKRGKYIQKIAYRYDDRYAVLDLILDAGKYRADMEAKTDKRETPAEKEPFRIENP